MESYANLTAFAAALWRPEDIIEIRVIGPAPAPGEKRPAHKLGWWTPSELLTPEVLARLQTRNQAGWCIYAGINPRTEEGGAKEDKVALARCLFVDFDGGVTPDEAGRRIRASGLPEPTVIVTSGHGTHCYWALIEPLTDLALWTAHQKALIAVLGSDKIIHDPPRIMRLPGFTNMKAEPVPADLVAAVAQRRYPLSVFPSGIVQLRAAALATSGPTDPGWRSKLSRASMEFIMNGAPGGERNPCLFKTACDAAGCGATQAEAEAVLVRPAVQSPGNHPFTEKEAIATIASAYSASRSPARPVRTTVPQIPASNGTSHARGDGTAPPSGGSDGTSQGGNPASWPDPRPLPDALPPVMAFNPALLPEALRGWIMDIADRIQCPADFPAVAAIIALSAIVGRKLGIRPKQHDDWTVVPNLWGAVIGRPGVMKTPAIQEPLKPLKRLEILAKSDFEKTVLESEAAKIVAGVKKKTTDQEIRKALKAKADAMEIARESLADEQAEPIRKRYVVNDTTVEKLGVILNENPVGVLAYRDELIGLLKSLDKDGQEGARAFYLEAWNGTGRYTYDRIGRGTLDIEAAIVSIIGGIQPGPLGQYLRAAAREGVGDDGLIQRFQLAVWPDISKAWINVDRWPDSPARDRAWRVFDGLDHLEPILLGADTDTMDPGGIPFLRFGPEAQERFNAWRETLEHTIRSGDLHPALESHLAKFRSLIPSLALLIHVADGGTGPVGVGPLEKAIAWGVYLRSHSERIYSQAVHPDLAAARALAKRLLDGQVKDGFALRDVYRRGWSGLASVQDAQGAVDLLADLDWLFAVREPTEGRTGTQHYINPKIHGLPDPVKNPPSHSEGTDRTAGSPPTTQPTPPCVGSGGADSEGGPEITPVDGEWGST